VGFHPMLGLSTLKLALVGCCKIWHHRGH
jgi:hypothetical protein